MRFFLFRPLILVALATIGLFSCTEEKEELDFTPLTDYMPVKVGKYITYRLDSLVTTGFGLAMETHSYQVKHVVDAEITDNLGRPSYRVFRYLNNQDGTGEWQANGSYMITPTQDQIEVVEDNLRIIKLHAPLRDGFNWRGNKFLPVNPYESFGFVFGNDDLMKNWDFTYDFSLPTFSYNGETYNDVYSVEQEDDIFNVPIDDPRAIAYRSRSVDRYSRDIGLVYREYILWEYQPNLSGPNPTYSGFGVTMWMIDHN